MKRVLRNYFYWSYPRGSIHYDVMVTLILAFIFVTPHLWNYGDKPLNTVGPQYPVQIVGNVNRGVIITMQASDVSLDPHTKATDRMVRQALRKVIESVTGDSLSVDRWETFTDARGKIFWKIWAHR